MKKTVAKTPEDVMAMFPTEQDCINYLEWKRWNGNVVSPFDATSQVYKCKDNYYQCRNTNRRFNVRTGTIYASTHLPLQKWFIAIYYYITHDKHSPSMLARLLGITLTTSRLIISKLKSKRI